jgi:hypothetical protein
MHAASLPGGADHTRDRSFEPFMGIRYDALHAFEAAPDEIPQEGRPEGLGLRGTEVQADDLAPSVGVDRHRDYGRDRHDATALAHLQVGGVEPQIRPLATERAGCPYGSRPLCFGRGRQPSRTEWGPACRRGEHARCGTEVFVYTYDHDNKPTGSAGMTGRVTVQEQGKTRTADLTPAPPNGFVGKLDAALAGGARVIVSLTPRNGKPVQARYTAK